MEIKYQNEANVGPQTFTGCAKNWPTGLYWDGEQYHILVDEGDVVILCDGVPSCNPANFEWIRRFTRLSDSSRVVSMTMAGAPLPHAISKGVDND